MCIFSLFEAIFVSFQRILRECLRKNIDGYRLPGLEGPGNIKEGTFMVEKTSEKSWEQLDELLDRYRGVKGSVIPILQQAQEIFGYLPKDVLIKISKEIDVPISQVYGVVTFYAQFHLEPRGKNIIRSCQGTACHVRGAKAVLNAIREKLCLGEGQVTTPDLQFTVETVACIGACGLAPCIMINDDTHGRLTADAVGPMLDKYCDK